jgi:plastocyanin
VPFTPGTVLDDGARYTLCASDWFLYYAAWSHRNTVCPSTIIDRNKPVVTGSVNGTAEVTNDPNLQLRIDYQDATSPPWFSSTQGQASNWTCVTMGQPCTPGGQPDTNCSWRHYANSKSDYFTCAASVAGQPDGKWYFCARSADAAVPDNPTGSNQFANAFSSNANLSDVACGWITVDRGAPSVTAAANATTVTTGQLVTFTASATDPSGVSGQIAWDFGDNTAAGSGASATHTYTQPGTYVARATTTDGAGNQGSATTTITVKAPTTPDPGTGGSTGGGTGGTGGTGRLDRRHGRLDRRDGRHDRRDRQAGQPRRRGQHARDHGGHQRRHADADADRRRPSSPSRPAAVARGRRRSATSA